MMGVMYTSPENSVQKHLFWLVRTFLLLFLASQLNIDPRQAFNGCQAATLSPMFFFAPAILSRAALYTCGVVGSLSYVGATAKYVFHLSPFSILIALPLPIPMPLPLLALCPSHP